MYTTLLHSSTTWRQLALRCGRPLSPYKREHFPKSVLSKSGSVVENTAHCRTIYREMTREIQRHTPKRPGKKVTQIGCHRSVGNRKRVALRSSWYVAPGSPGFWETNENTHAALGGTSIFSLKEVIYNGANW